jgi:hypothetical protein
LLPTLPATRTSTGNAMNAIQKAMRENERVADLYELEINLALELEMSPMEIVDYINVRFGPTYATWARDLPQLKVH